MAVLIILLCVFNLVMWLVAIVRFRKIFSTDDIISEAREQLDRLLMNINQNAERNITLIDERIRQLKEAEQEADKHIAILRGEIENAGKSKVFQERIKSISTSNDIEPVAVEEKKPRSRARSVTGAKSAPVKTPKNQVAAEEPLLKVRSPLASYEKESREQRMLGGRTSLQDEMDMIVERAGKTDFNVESADAGGLPNEFPKITNAAEMIKPKKSINKQVHELSDQGYTIEEIAINLGISTTEVKLILEF